MKVTSDYRAMRPKQVTSPTNFVLPSVTIDLQPIVDCTPGIAIASPPEGAIEGAIHRCSVAPTAGNPHCTALQAMPRTMQRRGSSLEPRDAPLRRFAQAFPDVSRPPGARGCCQRP